MIASTQTNQPFTGNADPNAIPPSIGDLLKKAKLRSTRPRRAIIAVLSSRKEPATIEEIRHALKPIHCDLVTVYRTMSMFEQAGIVRRSFQHNGTMMYEFNADRPSSYRVTCKISNAAEEIEPAIVAELRHAIAEAEKKLRQQGYAEVGHLVQFFGVAPAVTARVGVGAPAKVV
jgi:Fur family transcriptional regulator, ferric uptake regulator